MRHKDAVLGHVPDRFGDLGESWSVLHHLIGDPRDPGIGWMNIALRVDQRGEFIHHG